MPEYNYDEDFIRKKMNAMRKQQGSSQNLNDTLLENFGIDPKMLNRMPKPGRHIPLDYSEPKIIDYNKPPENSSSNWGVSLNEHFNSLNFSQVGPFKAERSVNFNKSFGPYMDPDGGNIIKRLSDGVFKFVLSNIFEELKNKRVSLNEYVANKQKETQITKARFVDYVNNNGWEGLVEKFQIPEIIIEEYVPYLDIDEAYKTQLLSSEFVVSFIENITKSTRSRIKWYPFMNFVKNKFNENDGTFMYCSKEFIRKLEDTHFSKNDFFNKNMVYQPYKGVQVAQDFSYKGGFKDKNIQIYSSADVDENTMVCFNGAGNLFDVVINSVDKLRPNEYYFHLNVSIDFSKIEILTIFD